MATVLLLREPSEARDLCFLLEEEGLTVAHWPVQAVVPVEGASAIALGEQLGRFSWVIPESPVAVRVLADVVRAAGGSTSQRVAFVAPNLDTVRALGRHGWEARHVLPERADGRLETLGSLLHEDDEVLWVGGPGEAEWRGWLSQVPGRATVVRLYEERLVPRPELSRGAIIVVESPSAAEALSAATDDAWRADHRVVASGPSTHQALRELGIEVAAVAQRRTTEALFEAIAPLS